MTTTISSVETQRAHAAFRPQRQTTFSTPTTIRPQPAFSGKTDTVSLSPAAKNAQIPKALQKNIESAAATLYGKAQAKEVTQQVLKIIQEAKKNRPAELLKEDFERPADWYKKEHAYMFYAERFGTENGKPSTFKSLIPMLGYMKNLGVSTFYLLPFLKSPGIDAGFDVSDYKQVRADLGGNKEFDEFLTAARKLKADLVLNHVSDQHPWFQAALKGDPEKLKYFISKDQEPIPKISRSLQDGTWAEYKEDDGTITKRRVIFPDAALSHYRKATVNGPAGKKDKFFYHTFYPHQLDLNWNNPKVLYEVVDVMGHWANKGIDMFRLDALPFFVKPKNSIGENTPGTHAVLQILSSSLQAMSPRSVLWAEICQKPTDIRPYYGKDHKYTASIPGVGSKRFERTNKVQLAYHFPEMSAIWAAMVTKKPDLFWQTMKETPQLPKSGEWSNFLRVHDELSMELFPGEDLQKQMYNALSTKGEPFREGHAVGGRLASFLDHDPRRINQSNAILLSLPGLPLLYYGDEIGEPNSPEFMKQAAKEREKQATLSGATVKNPQDARDIGRGPIAKERLLHAMNHPETKEGQIFQNTKNLIAIRKQEPALTQGQLSRIPASQEHIFSYLRELGKQRVLVANNLSDENTTVQLTLPRHLPVNKLPASGLHELQRGHAMAYRENKQQNSIQLNLKPYESVWIKLPENSGERSLKTLFSKNLFSWLS